MKIRIERTYPHAIEHVWSALTDARAIRQWWVDTDFEPTVGRAFFFQDTPQGSWDGRVNGKVLEVDAPRRIRFSWLGDGHETEVTYELFATPSGTRFVLTHEGFRGMRGLFLRTLLRFGWGSFVKSLLPEMAAHIAAHGVAVPFAKAPKAERVKPQAARV